MMKFSIPKSSQLIVAAGLTTVVVSIGAFILQNVWLMQMLKQDHLSVAVLRKLLPEIQMKVT